MWVCEGVGHQCVVCSGGVGVLQGCVKVWDINVLCVVVV